MITAAQDCSIELVTSENLQISQLLGIINATQEGGFELCSLQEYLIFRFLLSVDSKFCSNTTNVFLSLRTYTFNLAGNLFGIYLSRFSRAVLHQVKFNAKAVPSHLH